MSYFATKHEGNVNIQETYFVPVRYMALNKLLKPILSINFDM